MSVSPAAAGRVAGRATVGRLSRGSVAQAGCHADFFEDECALRAHAADHAQICCKGYTFGSVPFVVREVGNVARHRIRDGCCVVAEAVIGGLHHEYSLESLAA